jgi:hypothetical protein
VVSISGTDYTVDLLSTGTDFTAGETVQDVTSGATRTLTVSKPQYSAYLHEKGTDAVIGDQVVAIESYFETADFGYPTGGAQTNQVTGENRWTRITRIEPDFVQTGSMDVFVLGKEFANSPETISSAYNFTNSDGKVDMREQRREIRLKFVSNEVGGHYEMGRVILHTTQGDKRS